MKVEPLIHRDVLAQAVQQAYGLQIEALRYLPTGWLASCYQAISATGERYFLKLYTGALHTLFVASSLEYYLPLMLELHNRGILPHIPYPIQTLDGRLLAHTPLGMVILFNYIDGKVVGFDGMSDEILGKLASLLGILHRSTPEIQLPNPHLDDYQIVFETELVNVFSKLAGIGSGDRPGRQQLRGLLLPQQGQVLAYLRRLRELQVIARSADKPKVICHTDLHGENLMLNEQGHLYLLDWEGAILAPPEHDLFFLAGEDRFWRVFLPCYVAEAGKPALDGETFAFYTYRRGLEDLAESAVRILRSQGEESDALDVQIVADCLADLPWVEQTTARIRSRLASRPWGG